MTKYLRPKDTYRIPNEKTGEVIHKIVKWYFKPEYIGLENLAHDQPALYVSNHTLLGLTDGPLYMAKLLHKKEIYLRPLVDKMQRHIPIWRKLMSDFGGVIATKENCKELMQQKQHILVFPGGTNEAFKNDGEEYQLIWKERYGFVKMAIENNYPIIPIAGLGGDELYDIVLDKEDIMNSFVGKLLKDSGIAKKYLKGGENIPPIVAGLGGTFLPKPKRIYYNFGKAINTSQYHQKVTDDILEKIRIEVELEIYKGIVKMIEYRQKHGLKDNSFIRNLLNNYNFKL
ncbi:MAG: acyltransferase family protein [Flavobacteriales bacterium]|jgi:1-acyl-sn-glycerol-3-phosphate acyltransferase|nr:acyltransferase family protein [Flavobacteriales bacterium]